MFPSIPFHLSLFQTENVCYSGSTVISTLLDTKYPESDVDIFVCGDPYEHALLRIRKRFLGKLADLKHYIQGKESALDKWIFEYMEEQESRGNEVWFSLTTNYTSFNRAFNNDILETFSIFVNDQKTLNVIFTSAKPDDLKDVFDIKICASYFDEKKIVVCSPELLFEKTSLVTKDTLKTRLEKYKERGFKFISC